MEVGFMVKLVIWIAVVILVFLIVKRYIVDAGPEVVPVDALLG